MQILGLCGNSGSGKSSLCLEFSRLGVPFIDTDAIYRGLTSCKTACLDELASEFGDEIIATDGSLDRETLSRLVFFGEERADRKRRLEKIAHKHILNKVREFINEYRLAGVVAVIVDAPLLFESGFDAECDKIIAVTADYDMKIERIMIRDGIDKETAAARIASQLSEEYLTDRADFVVHNDGTRESLSLAAENIVKKLKE